MRWLRNRNVLAVMVVVILLMVIAAIGMTAHGPREISDEVLPGVEASDASTPATGASLYLLVTADNTTYAPILLDREEVLTLTQGEDKVNVIHVMPDRVWMESATCDNQDCVEQGEVTAENRKSRVLGNTIVCLPHRVLLEVFTADELRDIGILVEESADAVDGSGAE